MKCQCEECDCAYTVKKGMCTLCAAGNHEEPKRERPKFDSDDED